MKRCFRVLVSGIWFLWAGSAMAQEGDSSSWVQLPGTAVDISINEDGQAYSVTLDGGTWRWDMAEQRWRRMSGDFARISAAIGNRPWAINSLGELSQYNGLWWEPREVDVLDVAADTQGNVFIAKINGDIWKWYALRNEWQPITGTAKRLAIGKSGLPWAITDTAKVRAYDGDVWRTYPGRARDIAFGATDVVAMADDAGLVRIWLAARKRWEIVGGVKDIVSLAVTPQGNIWAVRNDGLIFANGGLTIDDTSDEATDLSTTVPRPKEAKPPVNVASDAVAEVAAAPVDVAPSAVAPGVVVPGSSNSEATSSGGGSGGNNTFTDPVTVTTTDAIVFVNTLKSAASLAIGGDGSVFGLDGAGGVLRWSNRRNEFESFPGELVRVTVDREGNPWGISALGRVFRHTGTLWKQITGATGSDISAGYDGTVLLTNAQGRIFRLNDAQTRFERVSGTGASLIAAGPDGTPWAVRSDQLVQRCDTNPCKVYAQKAKSISVGPDNSVYIVSTNNLLMRLDQDGKFIRVQTPGHTPASVAVGPMGYPWVVSDKGIALSSKFFDRDEGSDLMVANATSGDTVGTGETEQVVSTETSGVVFRKNIRFTTVPLDQRTGSVQVATASDGAVIIGGGNEGFEKYDERRKKFVQFSSSLVDSSRYFSGIDIAPNGDIWAIDTSMSAELYRERNQVVKEYSVSGFSPSEVTVAPDGTVFVIFRSGGDTFLYSKPDNSEEFKRFSDFNQVHVAGAGPGNDIWIVDKSNLARQWTGSSFELRPKRGSQKASSIDVGGNGTVYIRDTNNALRKWNGANDSFDEVNNAPLGSIAVDADGRPWIATGGSSPTISRARD
ncbi:tectonin domain-containing protein [Thalassospira lucentensis]|uniref:tectonin domain-containing protein n=1 Tax=Thalassospira lucentensis TaxID=168935 RepID=UPI003D2EF040